MVDHADDSAAVDSELVPSSLASIAPILRVANEIEKENPRVAYLCKAYSLVCDYAWNSAFILGFFFFPFFFRGCCTMQ